MRDHYQDMIGEQYSSGYDEANNHWLTSRTEGSFPDSGWKIRISPHPEDTQQAWNIVVDELNKSKGKHLAKVALPHIIEMFSNPECVQAGKMITIYTQEGVAPDKYKQMMFNIEKALQESGIRSGLEVKSDRPIIGSSYISYRNDRNAEGEYRSVVKNEDKILEGAYNLSNVTDPYKNFDIREDRTRQLNKYNKPLGVLGRAFSQAIKKVNPIKLNKAKQSVKKKTTTLKQ